RVYLATRELGDTTQHVALKIVPRAADGRRLVEQLRRERSILAGLDHPHIARFIDAGELPDGRPFFAMEYVDGVPLTRHCDEASLDLRARIALFLDVCDAVAYAHRRLVLHRDIKASNILVDAEGRPRLLDFGIAKSLADAQARDTTVGQNYFSLRTAAPEQVRGAATTVVTDVYGLGCLLCELLSGHLPFDLDSDDDLLRRVVEQPATLASMLAAAGEGSTATRRGFADRSALATALRGDLDTIVARTLRKDPADRYRSVDDLAADLRNVLDLRPIAARASERWYRLRMLLRRNRVTAIVAGVLGLAIVATTGLSITQSLRARAERDRAIAALEAAQLQRDHAQRVTDFLVGAFRGSDRAQGLTRDLRATELVDNAAASLQQNNSGLDPALRATLAQTLAHLFYLLQRTPEAVQQTELAREEIARLDAPSPELSVRQFLVDAEIANLQSRFTDAIDATAHGLALAGNAADYVDGEVLHMLWEVRLRSQFSANDAPAVVETARAAMRGLATRADHRPERFDWIRQRLAQGLYGIGKPDERRAEIERLAADQRRGGRTGSAAYIETLRQLGHSYLWSREYDRARVTYEEAAGRQVALFGEEHPSTPRLLGGLALVYSYMGRYRDAIALSHRVITLSERVHGPVQHFTSLAYYYAAERYFVDLGDFAQAERLTRKGIAALPPESQGNRALMHRRLAQLLLLQDKLFEASYHADVAAQTLEALHRYGNGVDNIVIDRAYIEWRRYQFASAQRLVSGSLLDRTRRRSDPARRYRGESVAAATELSAFFAWNRESDGSTIVPPLSR
ncbi:MAG TPA: serine/threonine-protein kinase, partial [Tahibacter sp.]|uniref:serine/threonine-protein kinase n=1 Tax=Tahibacter sp. TaxID=2056211 RepID=UPI002C1EC080